MLIQNEYCNGKYYLLIDLNLFNNKLFLEIHRYLQIASIKQELIALPIAGAVFVSDMFYIFFSIAKGITDAWSNNYKTADSVKHSRILELH